MVSMNDSMLGKTCHRKLEHPAHSSADIMGGLNRTAHASVANRYYAGAEDVDSLLDRNSLNMRGPELED